MSPGIVAESDLSGNLKSEYVFFGGKRVARRDFPSGAVSYYFSDHLGTASVVTNSAGSTTAESDYYPFGAELQILNTDSNKYKYGGHELDGETGNYDYGARYYSPAFSRFLTPDWAAKPITVPYADFGNPQSLNLYGYVRNNPTTLGDSDGHQCSGVSCFFYAQHVLNDPNLGKNLAIGAAKGLGNFTLGIGKALTASAASWVTPKPTKAAQAVMQYQPKALQPSNLTQAVASKTTEAALNVGSAAVAVASFVPELAGGGAVTAATGTTTLFRSVGTAEAGSIESVNAFTAAPSGAEYKGFFFSQSDAESFGQMSAKYGDTSTVYSTEAPTDLVNSSPAHSAAGEGPGTLIPNDKLNQLSPPKKVDPQ